MRFLWHFIINVIVLSVVGFLLLITLRLLIVIPMLIISAYWGAMYPDADQRFKKKWHRHWWHHSIYLTAIFWGMSIFFPMLGLLTALMTFSCGIHCISDVRFRRYKQTGFYTIKLRTVYSFKERKWKVKGLNGLQSTYWLILNFIAAIAILMIQWWLLL